MMQHNTKILRLLFGEYSTNDHILRRPHHQEVADGLHGTTTRSSSSSLATPQVGRQATTTVFARSKRLSSSLGGWKGTTAMLVILSNVLAFSVISRRLNTYTTSSSITQPAKTAEPPDPALLAARAELVKKQEKAASLLFNIMPNATHRPMIDKNNTKCSCWNRRAAMHCCQRLIVTAHKFGVIFSQSQFGPYSFDIGTRGGRGWPAIRRRRGAGRSPFFPILDMRRRAQYRASGHRSRAGGGPGKPPGESDGVPAKSQEEEGQAEDAAAMDEKMESFISQHGMIFRDIWFNTVPDVGNDYRHLAVVRNMYSAIVSGYLYHKSGRECWLNWFGQRWAYRKFKAWEHHIRLEHPPYPPVKKRTFCDYLAQESEQDGMRVYIDVALDKWYGNLKRYWNIVQRRREKYNDFRTQFVCLEEIGPLVEPADEGVFLKKALEWWYPGGYLSNLVKRVNLEQAEKRKKAHATKADQEEKERLTVLARRLDKELFNNTLYEIDSLFKCGWNKTASSGGENADQAVDDIS